MVQLCLGCQAQAAQPQVAPLQLVLALQPVLVLVLTPLPPCAALLLHQ